MRFLCEENFISKWIESLGIGIDNISSDSAALLASRQRHASSPSTHFMSLPRIASLQTHSLFIIYTEKKEHRIHILITRMPRTMHNSCSVFVEFIKRRNIQNTQCTLPSKYAYVWNECLRMQQMQTVQLFQKLVSIAGFHRNDCQLLYYCTARCIHHTYPLSIHGRASVCN